MTESVVRIRVDEARFGHEIDWKDGTTSVSRELRPDARVGGGTLLDRAAAAQVLPEDELRSLGQHLWAALAAPDELGSDGLCVRTDDPEILALPWHLACRGGTWLMLEGLPVRVEVIGAPSATHLGKDLRVLVGLEGDGHEALAWASDLEQLSGGQPTIDFVSEPAAILAGLVGRDVVCLPVDVERLRGGDASPLELGSGSLAMPALEAALIAHPPRLLLLEARGTVTFDLVRKAARLARSAPCVLVLGDPAREEFVPPGSQSRRLLRRMYEEGVSPAAACQRIATTGLDPTAWPRSFGGALPPRPRKLPAWLQDDSWRLTLDRRKQTALARGLILEILDSAPAASAPRDKRPGLALFWHGARGSGLGRLHHRLRHALRQTTRACQVLDPGWPESGYLTDDFAGLYAGLFDLDVLELEEPEELERALAHRYDSLPSGADQILYVDHGVLPVEWSRRPDGVGILRDYLEWWAEVFVPGVPARLTPVLAIAVETGEVEADLWDARLREAIQALRRDLRPVRAEVLPTLPDVTVEDVEDFIFNYGLDIPEKYQPRVAAELVETTRGHYEMTVHEIEQLPWNWRYWAHKARR